MQQTNEMSHRTDGTAVFFIHGGGPAGSVEIHDQGSGDKLCEVPFCDLKALVAGWVRSEIMNFAKIAEDDEVLLRYQRLWPPKTFPDISIPRCKHGNGVCCPGCQSENSLDTHN